MFNLEAAIAEWHLDMLTAGIKTPVPLEELESHLREAIAERRESGLNAEEAFRMATASIGSGAMIREEFEKADASRKAGWRLLSRLVILACLGLLGWSAYTLGMKMALFPLLAVAVILLGNLDKSILHLREKLKTSGPLRGLLVVSISCAWVWILFRSHPNPLESSIGLGLIGANTILLYHFEILKRSLQLRRGLRRTGLAVSVVAWFASLGAMAWCHSTGQTQVLFFVALFIGTLYCLFYESREITGQAKRIVF